MKKIDTKASILHKFSDFSKIRSIERSSLSAAKSLLLLIIAFSYVSNCFFKAKKYRDSYIYMQASMHTYIHNNT